MNVHELREMLEDLDGDTEVMIATQPSWPLAFTVAGVVQTEADPADGEGDEDEERDHHDEEDVVWIVTGSAPYPDPYAPRAVWEQL